MDSTCVHSQINNISINAKSLHQRETSVTSNSVAATNTIPAIIISHKNDDEFSDDNFFNLMKFERLRLITYILYGHRWPKMNQISPSLLAKAGFFYLKNDSVQCAFCRGIIKNWEKGDLPMKEHKRHYGNCPFVNGKFVGNVPLGLDAEIHNNMNTSENPNKKFVDENPGQEPIKVNYNKTMTPRFPMFNDMKTRALSFSHKNWTNSMDKKLFIDAGFFYTGKNDCTRCYHCGGVLFNWKPEEIPMEEHAHFFPECPFVISKKGPHYLEFVKFKKEFIEMRSKMDTPNSVKTKDINCMRKITFENFIAMKQSASEILNESDSTQATYQDYFKKLFFFDELQKLFHYFLGINALKPSDYPSNVDEIENDQSSGSSQRNSPASVSPCNLSDSDYSSSNSDCEDVCLLGCVDDISKNGDKNKSSLTCLICYDKQIQVVFLPCGHQLACMKCAAALNICPVCRTAITSKIRTYFASI